MTAGLGTVTGNGGMHPVLTTEQHQCQSGYLGVCQSGYLGVVLANTPSNRVFALAFVLIARFQSLIICETTSVT
jgi:hypothetical protein